MRRRLTFASVAGILVIAAMAAAVASADTAKRDPISALKREIVALKTQNMHLKDQYTPAGIARQLAKTKAALDKYRSVDAAKADGYAAASPCESTAINPEQTSYGGVMGIHFVNPALMKPGPIDPAKPPILVYLPAVGGGMQLAAAEYFKPDADQNVKTDDDRPILFGRAFDGPMQSHAPGMPNHYDLHVWFWKKNPSGLFAPWNPDAACA